MHTTQTTLASVAPSHRVHARARTASRHPRRHRASPGVVYGRRFSDPRTSTAPAGKPGLAANGDEPPPPRRHDSTPPSSTLDLLMHSSHSHRGVPHHCESCRRLLALQTGTSLHIKRKDFEGHVEGRASLRCRCGLVTVVVTTPAS
jgi:hypothetical protein